MNRRIYRCISQPFDFRALTPRTLQLDGKQFAVTIVCALPFMRKKAASSVVVGNRTSGLYADGRQHEGTRPSSLRSAPRSRRVRDDVEAPTTLLRSFWSLHSRHDVVCRN
ncbi:hypothetical protein KIN20_028077 [Parelaphostrongylus tenuis]|uniref:Uncharacterized protein n=1 Tax=Parelaphostrongylus tenuis TaxID=148309 RepID=A0AAD5R0H2_PARTN|nr:hypothetical protein KIN20_028077 [Parelaphostrongylus tenuis]